MSECQDPEGSLPAKELRNEAKGALGNQFRGRMLYKGKDKKEKVQTIQEMLLELGKDVGTKGADGRFGDDTEEAVKEFQSENKDWEGNPLKRDGLVGPRTSDALNRSMVGKRFECYQTPVELAKNTLLVTATRKAIDSGLNLKIAKETKARLVLVDMVRLHKITLLDPNDQPFSFEGEGKCKVLDSERNVRDERTIQNGDPIELRSPVDPFTVQLRVAEERHFFELKKKETEAEPSKNGP